MAAVQALDASVALAAQQTATAAWSDALLCAFAPTVDGVALPAHPTILAATGNFSNKVGGPAAPHPPAS